MFDMAATTSPRPLHRLDRLPRARPPAQARPERRGRMIGQKNVQLAGLAAVAGSSSCSAITSGGGRSAKRPHSAFWRPWLAHPRVVPVLEWLRQNAERCAHLPVHPEPWRCWCERRRSDAPAPAILDRGPGSAVPTVAVRRGPASAAGVGGRRRRPAANPMLFAALWQLAGHESSEIAAKTYGQLQTAASPRHFGSWPVGWASALGPGQCGGPVRRRRWPAGPSGQTSARASQCGGRGGRRRWYPASAAGEAWARASRCGGRGGRRGASNEPSPGSERGCWRCVGRTSFGMA
jgi:hypothetical protein